MPIENLTRTSFVFKGLNTYCTNCHCTISAGERVYPLGNALFCSVACRDEEERAAGEDGYYDE
jgi:hypothetical protein